MKEFVLALGIAGLLTGVPALADDAKKAEDKTTGTQSKVTEAAQAAQTAAPAAAQAAAQAAAPAAMAKEHKVFTIGDVKWADAPNSLPKGAKVAVLAGDHSAPGVFTMRILLPAGYRIPPHSHPADEHVTVISGEFHIAPGETFDDTKGHELEKGSFAVMPAGMKHYAWVTEETVLQLHGMGPWGITYVNPQDDPRNAKQATK